MFRSTIRIDQFVCRLDFFSYLSVEFVSHPAIWRICKYIRAFGYSPDFPSNLNLSSLTRFFEVEHLCYYSVQFVSQRFDEFFFEGELLAIYRRICSWTRWRFFWSWIEFCNRITYLPVPEPVLWVWLEFWTLLSFSSQFAPFWFLKLQFSSVRFKRIHATSASDSKFLNWICQSRDYNFCYDWLVC